MNNDALYSVPALSLTSSSFLSLALIFLNCTTLSLVANLEGSSSNKLALGPESECLAVHRSDFNGRTPINWQRHSQEQVGTLSPCLEGLPCISQKHASSQPKPPSQHQPVSVQSRQTSSCSRSRLSQSSEPNSSYSCSLRTFVPRHGYDLKQRSDPNGSAHS